MKSYGLQLDQIQRCVVRRTPVGGIESLMFLYVDSIRLNAAAVVTLYPFKALQPLL